MATTKATTLAHTLGGISSDISTAEINRLDGVTGDIQTLLNLKAPIASPTFTGTADISSGATFPSNPTLTLGSNATLPVGTVVNVTTMRGSSGTTWDLDNVFTESSITNSQRYNTTNFFKVTPSKSGNTFVIIGNFPIGFNNASGGDAGLTLELGVTVGSGSEQYPSSLSTDGMLGNNHSIYQNSGSTDFIFPFAHTYYYTTGSIDVHSFGINLKAYGVNSISFNLYNNRAIVNVLEVQS